MKTKEEILKEIEWRKELYKNRVKRYELICERDINSENYKVYRMLKEIEESKLEVINDLLDFINGKID